MNDTEVYCDASDRWYQDGSYFEITMTDGYSIYTGQIDGNTISGSAENTVGHSWTFEGTRD